MNAYLKKLSALILCLLIAGTVNADEKTETETNFANYNTIAIGIAKTDKVVLYEGLPHQLFERDLLEQELKTKKTVRFQGFPFYAKPLMLKDADVKALKKLITTKSSFGPWKGYKKCGGFHPDYCLVWGEGKKTYHAHVCFGCHEMKVFGPGIELYCEISSSAYTQLQKTLKPYQDQRPKAKN